MPDIARWRAELDECDRIGLAFCPPDRQEVRALLDELEGSRAEAANYRGAVEDRDELADALQDVLNHWVLSDEPEVAVLDRASEVLDRVRGQ